MKVKLTLTALMLATLAPIVGQAAIRSELPSAKLEPLLEPCLDAILAPLEEKPKMPRVKVETLRATFAAGVVTASTPAEKEIYENAMAVCDAMTSDMDARANAQAAAKSAAQAPTLSTGGDIIASADARGRHPGPADQAIRAKQADERAYEDKRAKTESAFVDSSAYTSWVKNGPDLRQNVMNLYTKQVELEALYTKSTGPSPAPPTAIAQATGDSADGGGTPGNVGYGTFSDGKGQVIIVSQDHTAVRLLPSGAKAQGTWSFNEQGQFHIKFKSKTLTGDFSQGGRTFTSVHGTVFTRAD